MYACMYALTSLFPSLLPPNHTLNIYRDLIRVRRQLKAEIAKGVLNADFQRLEDLYTLISKLGKVGR